MALSVTAGAGSTLKTTLDGSDHVTHHNIDALAAGETHVGEVGGSTALVSVTPALDTAAVAVGDVINTSTATITDAVRVNDGTGLLQSIQINCKDDVSLGFYIVLLNANVSLGTANSPPSIPDADADNILAIIPVYSTDFVDLGGTRVATIGPDRLGQVVKGVSGGKNIYLALIAIDAGTYTVSGLVFRFGILRD